MGRMRGEDDRGGDRSNVSLLLTIILPSISFVYP